jgi:hypothetical protein
MCCTIIYEDIDRQSIKPVTISSFNRITISIKENNAQVRTLYSQYFENITFLVAARLLI